MTVPDIGDTIDIFILRSMLHKGVMSTLFTAEDLLSGETVVLKIPETDILNTPVLLYHHQNEDRISRYLDHPGIIRFIHRQRSRQYIIMEYASGKDLRKQVGRNRKMDFDSALKVMKHLCNAVGFLHDRSIVHLDIKPENIICDKDHTIKLIDFGLASCRKLPDLLALDIDNPMGTPWYIAPEQLLGERSDPRCDIYAMGILLYEMLTGHLPWPRSKKKSVALRRLKKDPTPPRFYNPDIPPQVQQIILCAAARHPEKRYASVKDLQKDLLNWQGLTVTDKGKQTRRPGFWRTLFSGKNFHHIENKQIPQPSTDRLRIVGALVDSPETDAMMEEVKRQALIRSATVVLVHVIEEQSDSSFRRYGIAAEGEQLMKRIETVVQGLRRLNIDPGIRLIRGDAADILSRMGSEADLIILGKSRKRKGLLAGKTTCQKMIAQSKCKVLVADENAFFSPESLAESQPALLSDDQVLSFDITLVDLWYEHLHYHTDFIYHLLLSSKRDKDLCEHNCRFGRFLTLFENKDAWIGLIADLIPIHREFHRVAEKMASLDHPDPSGLHAIYVKESLPLSFHLKKEIGKTSARLRKACRGSLPAIPFLAQDAYPFTTPDIPCYGPLMRVCDINRDLGERIKASFRQKARRRDV